MIIYLYSTIYHNYILHYYIFDNKYYKLVVFNNKRPILGVYDERRTEWGPIKIDLYTFKIPDILNMKYDVKFHHIPGAINNEVHFCILEYEKLVYKQLLAL